MQVCSELIRPGLTSLEVRLVKMNLMRYISCYLIVESVSFVLLRDENPINPKRTIEIINSRMYTDTSLNL